MGSGAMATAAVSQTTLLPLPLGKSRWLSISSSRSHLLGLGSISRGQSLPCNDSRGIAAVRASSEEGARKDAVGNGSGGGLERRQLLLGTTAAAAGLTAGASNLVLPASAELVTLSTVTDCKIGVIQVKKVNKGSVYCCPPVPGVKIKDFQFPKPTPQRLRKPAHGLTPEEKDVYENAYAAINELPDEDPRSFMAQAEVHCAYCNYGYFQQDGVTPFQVHNNWLFFPFHRWYLYFHERILAKFSGDPNFALAYWNYDNQLKEDPLPNTIPLMFTADPRKYPTLSSGIRNAAHYPNKLVDFNGSDREVGDDVLRAENNKVMYTQLVSGAKTPSLFFGKDYRAGQGEPNTGSGTVENKPHGPVHGFAGGTGGFREDMGNFYSAARDTLFYSHHANVDRLWTVWKTLDGGRRVDLDDPDWLNSSFLFYDENADLVRVNVRDSLDTAKLGYTYTEAPDKWKYAAPNPVSKVAAVPLNSTINFLVPGGMEGASAIAAEVGTPRKDPRYFGTGKRVINNESGLAFKLARPDRPKLRGTRGTADVGAHSLQPLPPVNGPEDYEEEILVISGITFPATQQTSFDVFINLPDADKTTSVTVPNYAGSYFNVAHSMPDRDLNSDAVMKTNLRIGLTDTLALIGAATDPEIVVTLVPEDGKTPIVVEDVKIEFE